MLITRYIVTVIGICNIGFAAEIPAIRQQGIVQAASQIAASAGGSMTPGSIVTVHGVNFAATPAGNTLRVKTRAASVTLPALRAAANGMRVDFWLPSNLPIGDAEFAMRVNGQESRPVVAKLSRTALGLFSSNEKGWGPARADQGSASGARSRNGVKNSGSPGQSLILFATGASLQQTPQILVAGQPAKVISVKQGKNHELEITIQIPARIPEGCFVPVYGKIPGSEVSNVVSLAIHRGGGACVRSAGDLFSGWSAGKTGAVLLSRTAYANGDANRTGDKIEDQISASFSAVRPENVFDSPLLMMPPVGTCTAYTTALDADSLGSNSLPSLLMGALSGEPLRAGTSIRLGNSTIQLQVLSISGAPGLYQRKLSGGIPLSSPQEPFQLDSGIFFVSGSGGADVGRFGVTLPAPSRFAWGVGDPPTVLSRSAPLAVKWTGAAAQSPMAILATTVDLSSNSAGLAYCAAPAGASSYVIPADLLAHLPSGEARLVLASWSSAASATLVSGLEHLIGLSVFVRSANLAMH